MSCDLKVNFKNDQVMYCPNGVLEGEQKSLFSFMVSHKLL